MRITFSSRPISFYSISFALGFLFFLYPGVANATLCDNQFGTREGDVIISTPCVIPANFSEGTNGGNITVNAAITMEDSSILFFNEGYSVYPNAYIWESITPGKRAAIKKGSFVSGTALDIGWASYVSVKVFDPNTIYLGYSRYGRSARFAKSSNGGISWTRSIVEGLPAGWDHTGISASLQAPSTSTLYFGYIRDRELDGNTITHFYVKKSTDGGMTWALTTSAPLATGIFKPDDPENSNGIRAVAIAAPSNNTIFAVYKREILASTPCIFSLRKSTDGGSSWSSPANLPFSSCGLAGLYIRALDAATIYISNVSQVVFSNDGGSSFQLKEAPPLSSDPGSFDLIDINKLIIAYRPGIHLPRNLDFTKSIDRGDSWSSVVLIDGNLQVGGIVRSDIAVRAADFDNISLVYSDVGGAGDRLKFSKSTNSGLNWSSPKIIDPFYAALSDLTSHPVTPDLLYLVYSSHGLPSCSVSACIIFRKFKP